jgi:hypothetical protein
MSKTTTIILLVAAAWVVGFMISYVTMFMVDKGEKK